LEGGGRQAEGGDGAGEKVEKGEARGGAAGAEVPEQVAEGETVRRFSPGGEAVPHKPEAPAKALRWRFRLVGCRGRLLIFPRQTRPSRRSSPRRRTRPRAPRRSPCSALPARTRRSPGSRRRRRSTAAGP